MEKNIRSGFTVSAHLTGCRPMVDRGMSITFHTKELSEEEQVQVIKYLNNVGWLLFKDNEVQEEEIPKQDSDFESKTPSQRLRGVLYVYWQQQGAKGDFKDFYTKYMEQFISSIKQNLD